MRPLYFTFREGVKVHDLGSDFLHSLWTIEDMTPAAIGRRLSALHVALEISQADVCRALGIKENRYSQYVGGERRLTIDIAARMVATYGVTLDWLYLGNPSALPAQLHHKLSRVAAA